MTSPTTSAAPQATDLKGGFAQVLLATIASTIAFWAWMSISPLQKTYATEMGLDEGQISLMLATPVFEHVPQHAATNFARPIRRVASAGLLALVIIAFSGWGLKRFLFADTFAGYFNSNHVRFGPHNTNDMK